MPEWESSEGSGEFLQLAWSMRNGSDIANFSELRLTAHSGTHVDVLGHVFEHYYDACFNVDTLELAVLNGPALLVDVPRDKNITENLWKKEFDTSYVGFMKDGAQWLVDNTDIKLVGVDYLSVGAFDECIPAHLVFLEKRVRATSLSEISVIRSAPNSDVQFPPSWIEFAQPRHGLMTRPTKQTTGRPIRRPIICFCVRENHGDIYPPTNPEAQTNF
uniref:Cyclase family protein n=1 Tax=Zea mays TaxID=4577 RepID=A0A804PAS7_MAIZE